MGKNTKAIQAWLKRSCCIKCGTTKNLTCDHIRPRSLGFLRIPNNRQPLCYKCNIDKGILSIDYSTKTLILEPFIFRLRTKDRKLLLTEPDKFGSKFFNPHTSLYKRYNEKAHKHQLS